MNIKHLIKLYPDREVEILKFQNNEDKSKVWKILSDLEMFSISLTPNFIIVIDYNRTSKLYNELKKIKHMCSFSYTSDIKTCRESIILFDHKKV